MNNKEQKKISIVIPNLDGHDFLVDCLASLKKQSFQNFELILVDNGSTDKSIGLTTKEFPEATIYSFSKNEGFSRAVNKGISLSQGDYVFLLNNDTELDKDCLQVLNDFLNKNPTASFVATKMLYFDNRHLINSTGDIFSIYGLAHQRGFKEKDLGQYNHTEQVFSACAGGAIYRRELFDEVGIFDEDFFAYLEDIDFSFRAQSMGYKCYYVPQAVIYHVDGGTSKRTKNLTHFLTIRNSLYVVYKNFPLTLLILALPFLFVGQIRNMISGIRHHYFFSVLKAYGQFFKELPKLTKKRRNIQGMRRTSTISLWRKISKKYPFGIKKHIYAIFFRHH